MLDLFKVFLYLFNLESLDLLSLALLLLGVFQASYSFHYFFELGLHEGLHGWIRIYSLNFLGVSPYKLDL